MTALAGLKIMADPRMPPGVAALHSPGCEPVFLVNLGEDSRMPDTRTATFAGVLDHGDWAIADGYRTVTIDRQPRGMLDRCPPELVVKFKETLGGDFPAALTATLDSAATKHGAAFRSPRPFTCVSVPWLSDFAGKGFEQVAGQAAAHADLSGFPPGIPVEVWSLPVVNAMFDFLITPAGDWPPEDGSE